MSTPLQVITLATKYRSSVLIPVHENKGTFLADWPRRTTPPTDDDLEHWRGYHSVAILTGAANGGHQVFDFDNGGSEWQEFAAIVEGVRPGFLSKFPLVQTRHNGYQLHFRCPTIGKSNQVLAGYRVPQEDTSGEPIPNKFKTKLLIELWGEGFLATCPGTKCHDGEYKLLSTVDITDAPLITPEEREFLVSVAKSFNILPEKDGAGAAVLPNRRDRGYPPSGPAPTVSEARATLPGDDFNVNADWIDVLGPHDWTIAYEYAYKTYWCKPGQTKRDGIAATTGVCKGQRGEDLFYVFAQSASPFEGGHTYSKFAAYATLNHGGNFSAAASALASNGYGKQNTKESPTHAAIVDALAIPVEVRTSQNEVPQTASDVPTVVLKETPLVETPSPAPDAPVDVQFPTECLPEVMRDIVEATADTYGVDPAIPATWALATLSASTGNLATVHDGHLDHLPTSLYAIIVADSGSGKTLASGHITAPFIKATDAAQKQYNEDVMPRVKSSCARVTAEAAGIKAQILAIRAGRSKKLTVADIPKFEAELKELERDRLDILHSRRGGSWRVDDITPERLTTVMERSYSRAAFIASESAGLNNMLGLTYGTGSQEGKLLTAYDHSEWKYQRQGTSPDEAIDVAVTNPVITLVATYTPALFHKMMANIHFRESGFLARCLVLAPPAQRRLFGRAVDQSPVDMWAKAIRDLCGIPVPLDHEDRTPDPIPLAFTPDAAEWLATTCQTKFDGFHKQDLPDPVKTFVNRADSQPVRIAALFHILNWGTQYGQHPIDLDTLQAGFRVYDYYRWQFVHLMERAETGTDSNNLDKLLAYVGKHPEGVTKTQVNNAIRWNGTGKRASLAEATLLQGIAAGRLAYDASTRMYALATPAVGKGAA
jgi:hypothetical protein